MPGLRTVRSGDQRVAPLPHIAAHIVEAVTIRDVTARRSRIAAGGTELGEEARVNESRPCRVLHPAAHTAAGADAQHGACRVRRRVSVTRDACHRRGGAIPGRVRVVIRHRHRGEVVEVVGCGDTVVAEVRRQHASARIVAQAGGIARRVKICVRPSRGLFPLI